MMAAETIAKALGGRKVGRGWMARCPAHEDSDPSLSIQDGDDRRVLARCHAGCDQMRVIAALRAHGLWPKNARLVPKLGRTKPRNTGENRPVDGDTARGEVPLRIWHAAASASTTPVETYLASRGIGLVPPPTLRFHVGLKHPSGGIWPAMVALVTRGADDAPLAIHRTFLTHDGRGKAPVEPARMMLGPCRGGAVRLAPAGDALMVGEGIETCLAAMQATGRPAWAALSTAGLRTLDLPVEVRDVTVLADGDEPGEAAARDAALRWKRQGRRVRIARPPRGLDFNDLLLGRAPRRADAAA